MAPLSWSMGSSRQLGLILTLILSSPLLAARHVVATLNPGQCNVCAFNNAVDPSQQAILCSYESVLGPYPSFALPCDQLLRSGFIRGCAPSGCPDAASLGCACTPKCNDTGPTPVVTCLCPAMSAGACADPHFRGAFGVAYDFHCVPDKDFAIITDADLHVNAHFIGQNGRETGFDGTWMSALGIVWNQEGTTRNLTIDIENDADLLADEDPFVLRVDESDFLPEASALDSGAAEALVTMYESEGLIIKRLNKSWTYNIVIPPHLDLTVIAARHEHPDGNHLDVLFKNLNVSATVHGALGQTFAESRRAALQEAAASAGSGTRFDEDDIVEGKDMDYMTSSLLATDSHFSRFRKPSNGRSVLKRNVVQRKLLAFEYEDRERTEGISCFFQGNGQIKCGN